MVGRGAVPGGFVVEIEEAGIYPLTVDEQRELAVAKAPDEDQFGDFVHARKPPDGLRHRHLLTR